MDLHSHITSSSRLSNINNRRDDVWISDLNELVVVSIEKMPRQCLTTFPNTSKLAKNTPLRVVFSVLFSVINAVKHGLSWLMYYFKYYLEHLMNGFQQ